jgi:hypothetical protein
MVIRGEDDRTVLNSAVKWTDSEGLENRRIVLNIADEDWDSFLEFWKTWVEESSIAKN